MSSDEMSTPIGGFRKAETPPPPAHVWASSNPRRA